MSIHIICFRGGIRIIFFFSFFLKKKMPYLELCFKFYYTCCSEPSSTLSTVADIDGLIPETMAVTSICRVQITG